MSLHIRFGIMAEPLKKQLAAHKLPAKAISIWQRATDGILFCCLHQYLSEAEAKRAFRRILKRIEIAIEKNTEGS